MIAALVVLGVAVVLWLAWEIRRAPLVCDCCEVPVAKCRNRRSCSQTTEHSAKE